MLEECAALRPDDSFRAARALLSDDARWKVRGRQGAARGPARCWRWRAISAAAAILALLPLPFLLARPQHAHNTARAPTQHPPFLHRPLPTTPRVRSCSPPSCASSGRAMRSASARSAASARRRTGAWWRRVRVVAGALPPRCASAAYDERLNPLLNTKRDRHPLDNHAQRRRQNVKQGAARDLGLRGLDAVAQGRRAPRGLPCVRGARARRAPAALPGARRRARGARAAREGRGARG